MHFDYPQKVLFKHCDPAGIVFFPRYAEMVNDAVEAFFSDCLEWPFEAMHPDAGVPTAEISMQFQSPSRHGEHLNLRLTILRIGRSSLVLTIHADCNEQTRFIAQQVLVCVDAQGKSRQWPDAVRSKIGRLLEIN